MDPTSDDLDAYAGSCDGTTERRGTAQRRPYKEFIKGPLPVGWMARAAGLPGQALAVALAIWFRRGIEGTKTFPLYPSALERFRVNRWSSYRALTALETAGLVTVKRRRGHAPVVTLLDLAPEESAGAETGGGREVGPR